MNSRLSFPDLQLTDVGFSIQFALPELAGPLSEIARAAKSAWGYPAHWLEAWREALTIRPCDILQHRYFVAISGGEILGFVGLHISNGGARVEHLWVTPKWWGKGIGRALFERAVDAARSLGLKQFAMEADPHAAKFYERMGARVIGGTRSEMDGIERVLPILVYDVEAWTTRSKLKSPI